MIKDKYRWLFGVLTLVLSSALAVMVQGSNAQESTTHTADPALTPGSLAVNWVTGAPDCSRHDEPNLQVHSYSADTYILRQNPCATFEAPFIYLLIGQQQALLLDTGAIAEEEAMPLASTVLNLLPRPGGVRLPLVVAHTHSHLDHRAGDAQFANLPDVEIIGPEPADIQDFFGLSDWPEGVATLDLGQRPLEIVPVPGHHPASIAVYDNQTGLLLTGDFLLPGRVYINDRASFRRSSRRLLDFVDERPITHVLGGHLEMNSSGRFYRPGATHHPDERALQLAQQDIAALAETADSLGRFSPYQARATFALVNYAFILPALGVLLLASVGAFTVVIWRFIRKRRRL